MDCSRDSQKHTDLQTKNSKVKTYPSGVQGASTKPSADQKN